MAGLAFSWKASYLLGYDVYWIEDTGGWAYNPLQKTHGNGSENTHASNCQYAVNYVAQLMSSFGLQDLVGLTCPG